MQPWEGEARFRTLVDSIRDYAIFLLSADGTIETWNEGAQQLKGYAPEEIIGRNFETFYTPEDRADGRPKRLLALARAEGRVEDEGLRVRKDGSRFWADVVITALHDGAGDVIGYAKVTRDLTERRQAEQERALRMAAERTADRFERLQAATAALAAASRQQDVAEILKDTATRSLGAADAIVTFSAHAGRSLEIEARFEPGRLLDADERAFLLALTEVGAQALDRARLYESEHAARAEAEAAVRAQDEFLSIASHELRTPVAAIKATAQLSERAIQRGQFDTARITRHMATIARASDRLNALVEDLLDLSRLRTGQLQLRFATFDIIALTHEIVGRYSAASDGHRYLVLVPERDLNVDADALRIEQVLDNLLSNAVKYSPKGGDITVQVRVEADRVCVSVTDAGIGLPAGQENRIFETFGRASNAAVQQIPGLGLGLSICRQLIERHGGSIWASSPGEDRGTTLAFWLPADGHG